MDGLYVRRIDGPVTEGDKELFVYLTTGLSLGTSFAGCN